MFDRTTEGSHHRAQPLSLALGAQHGINVDDLIDNGVQDVADLTAALKPILQAEARNSLSEGLIAELHAAKIRLTVLNGCIKKEKGLTIYQPFFILYL